MPEPDLEPGNIIIAVVALASVIVIMIGIAVCFLATGRQDEEIELELIIEEKLPDMPERNEKSGKGKLFSKTQKLRM